MRYDLIVLGHDCHGRLAALAAVQCEKRVAPPAQSLRHAALLLSGFRRRENGPQRCVRDRQETMQQLCHVSNDAVQQEAVSFEARLRQHGVDLIDGLPRFVGPNEIGQ